MSLNERDTRLRQGIEANPNYVGNNKGKFFERIKKAFEEAKLEPKNIQLETLRKLLGIIESSQLATGCSSDDVVAHRARIDISFTIASLTMGTPQHLQAAQELRNFAMASFESLIESDPQEALFVAKLPVSKIAQTKNLKGNLDFIDWGMASVDRMSQLESVAGNPALKAFAKEAGKDLGKQRKRFLECKDIQKNTAGN